MEIEFGFVIVEKTCFSYVLSFTSYVNKSDNLSESLFLNRRAGLYHAVDGGRGDQFSFLGPCLSSQSLSPLRCQLNPQYTLGACFTQRGRWVLIFTSSLELERGR